MTAGSEQEFDCPRCGGSGTYSIVLADGNGVDERCRACARTGRVTRREWQEWCDIAYGRAARQP